jgi:histidinol-phosphate aminotransferase
MYHGGSNWISGEPPSIKDFSVNLNPLGTPKFIEELLIEAIKKKVYQFYPDDYNSLKTKIAEIYNVNPEHIGVFNGSIEAIRLLPEKYSVPEPNFSEYPRADSYRCLEKDNEYLCKLQGRKVITSNPINPTGYCFSKEEILSFISNSEELILDEVFSDISLCESAIDLIDDFNNLLIISSFTKSLAVPGLRIGFSIGKKSKDLEKRAIPWRIDSITYYVFSHLDVKEIKKYLNYSKLKIKEIKDKINNIKFINNIKLYKSTAPFMLVELPIASRIINQFLRKLGFQIREPVGFIGLRETHARIALREETYELLSIIDEILSDFKR